MSRKKLPPVIQNRDNNWYIYLFLAAILAYSPFAIDPVLQIRYVVLAFTEIIGILLILKHLYGAHKIEIVSIPFIMVWLAYWLFSIIGIFIFGNPSGDSIYIWLQIFLAGALPIVLSMLFLNKENYIHTVLKLFLILGVVVIVHGFYQLINVAISGHFEHNYLYQVSGLFAHKNIFAEVLLLLFPLALIATFQLKKIWKFLGFTIAILCFLLILLLLSRAVWLAFALSFTASVVLFAIFNWMKPIAAIQSVVKKIVFLILLVTSLSIAGVVVFANQSFKKSVASQIHDLVTPKAFANKDRLGMWVKTLDIVKEHPLTGIGMGNWKIEILKEGNKNLQSEDNVTFFQRPHNDFLWIMSEQGIPALFLYLIAMGIIVAMACRLSLVQNTLKDRFFYILLIFSLLSYLVFSFFSFPKERVEHIVIIGFIISIVFIQYHKIFKTKSFFLPKSLAFGILIVFSLAFLIGLKRYQSELHLKKAYEARAQGEWTTVISEIENATSSHFKMDFVSTPLDWYKGEAYFNQNKINDAFNCFLEAKKTNPYHMHVLNNLGTCYEINGEHDKAIECYTSALSYTGYFEDALFNLCAVYYNLKDNDLSIKTLQQIKPGSEDTRYPKFSKVIIERYLTQIIDTTKDDMLRKYIFNIRKDVSWYRNIFEKSIAEKIDYSKQLLLDVIWIVENVDGNKTLAIQMRKKYYI